MYNLQRFEDKDLVLNNPGAPRRFNQDRLLEKGKADVLLQQEELLLEFRHQEWRRRCFLIPFLTLVPCLCFLAMGIMVLLCFFKEKTVVVTVYGVLVFASLSCMLFGPRLRCWRGWVPSALLGALCILGLTAGAWVGLLAYGRHMVYYYKLIDGRTYTNVSPASQANVVRDGAMILFQQSAMVDELRSLGYKDPVTGQMHCVAPIVDHSMSPTDPVSFFAVGEDCCNYRETFSCDSANDPISLTALLMLEPQEVMPEAVRRVADATGRLTSADRSGPMADSSSSSSSYGGTEYGNYLKAIRIQQANFNTLLRPGANGPEIRLLRWVKNPMALRDQHWVDGLDLVKKWSVVYLIVAFVLSLICTAHFIRSERNQLLKRLENGCMVTSGGKGGKGGKAGSGGDQQFSATAKREENSPLTKKFASMPQTRGLAYGAAGTRNSDGNGPFRGHGTAGGGGGPGPQVGRQPGLRQEGPQVGRQPGLRSSQARDETPMNKTLGDVLFGRG